MTIASKHAEILNNRYNAKDLLNEAIKKADLIKEGQLKKADLKTIEIYNGDY